MAISADQIYLHECDKCAEHAIINLKKHTGIAAKNVETKVHEYFDTTTFNIVVKTAVTVSFDIDELTRLIEIANSAAIIKEHYKKEYDELLVMAMLRENDSR